MATLPFAGVKVLDLSRLLPGPFCSMVLADYGADVIKIEDPVAGDYLRHTPPKTDGKGAYFEALNRNKRSVTLNLKTLEGVTLFRRLVQSADVLLESFRPGVMDRLGIGWEALRQSNPGLIYCSLTGYGQTGPYQERSGHDLNYMALAGALAGFAGDDCALPVLPGVQVADMAGAMYAAFSISMALYARQRSGTGTYLDVAMLDGALSWLPFGAAWTSATGQAPRPGQTVLTGATARYGTYRTRDGRFVALAALEDKFWQAFCEAAEHPEWVTMTAEPGPRQELERYFAERTQSEWTLWASERDLCLEPVLELAETLAHPQVRARGMVVEGIGATAMLGAPVRVPGVPTGPRTAAPSLGEHTDEVLGALGMSPADCAALRARGVL